MQPEIIKVRYKSQVTIPRYFREKLDIKEGDYLSCEIEGNRLIIRKQPLYSRAGYDDGIWKLVATAEDKDGCSDVSVNKQKYLGQIKP